MKTFPQPLSAKEEAFYLQKWSEGDLDARNMLIEHNLRLVAHIVKKYQTSDLDSQDLLSIGTIGLIKAIETFDMKKGKLGTYAAKCIENELLMLFRSRKKIGKEISLYEPIGNDFEGNEIRLLDILESDQEDPAQTMDFQKNVKFLYEYAKKTLTKREWDILCLRFGLNHCEARTQREIAEALGISRSYVSRIEKKAICKLKDCFLAAGLTD